MPDKAPDPLLNDLYWIRPSLSYWYDSWGWDPFWLYRPLYCSTYCSLLQSSLFGSLMRTSG